MNVPAVIAWTLLIACALRMTHVIASNVWIVSKGQRFKEFETQARRKKAARRTPGQSKKDAWKATILTPEERWSLYKKTGGDRFPLFFGIRSHRLLVASRRTSGVSKFVLIGVRLLWLNWVFPVIASAGLLWVAYSRTSATISWVTFFTAAALGLSCAGTVVGGVLATFTMGGFARHHDSWVLHHDAKANAVAEFGYKLFACAYLVVAGSVFNSVVAIRFAKNQVDPDLTWIGVWLRGLNTTLPGTTGEHFELAGGWGDLVSVVSFACVAASGVAMAITSTSVAKILNLKS